MERGREKTQDRPWHSCPAVGRDVKSSGLSSPMEALALSSASSSHRRNAPWTCGPHWPGGRWNDSRRGNGSFRTSIYFFRSGNPTVREPKLWGTCPCEERVCLLAGQSGNATQEVRTAASSRALGLIPRLLALSCTQNKMDFSFCYAELMQTEHVGEAAFGLVGMIPLTGFSLQSLAGCREGSRDCISVIPVRGLVWVPNPWPLQALGE